MAENPLFADTVTLYHADPAAHTVTRRVLRGVYLQTGTRQKPDVKGDKLGTSFLLVIPAAVREECYIEVISYGGDTTGYQIPFVVHYTGVKTKGIFDVKTKTFTAA